MTKKTKMWVAGGALAAVAVGAGVYYYQKKNAATATSTPAAPGQLTAVNSFSKGKAYKFAAMLPNGINDTSALEAALTKAGWANVNVLFMGFFMDTGDASPFPIAANGYVAQGTWNGADATALPNGVVAVTA